MTAETHEQRRAAGGGLDAELAGWDDAKIAAFLHLRPDIATPPPASLAVLAGRAAAAPSISLAGDDLDVLAVAVVEHLLRGVRATDELRTALADRAPGPDVDARIGRLRDLALVWGPDAELQIPANLAAAMPWRAPQATARTALRSLTETRDALAGVTGRPAELLTALAHGNPVGRSRDAAPGADPASPVQQLLRAGLVVSVDKETVELAPVVTALLRGEDPADPRDLAEPRFAASPAADAEATAGGEAHELLRHTSLLLEVLGRGPAAGLRGGGLGVRELRRIARDAELPLDRVGLLVEVLAEARLIAFGHPDPSDLDDDSWAPTAVADAWLHSPPHRRWLALLEAWLRLPRRPWLIGSRSSDGSPLGAVSPDNVSPAAAPQRALVLRGLAATPPGIAPTATELGRYLAWRRPRAASRLPRAILDQILAETAQLGATGRGALITGLRLLLDGAAEEDVLAALEAALPTPIDYFLAQADLTVTAPGPLVPEVAAELGAVADLESGGAASVYRVSDSSVRRALDSGRTAAELHGFFDRHSRTPVPQGLTFLVDDVARRHGRLRAGVATSYLRCEDPAVLAAVMASAAAERAGLRALAPTVAVSAAPLRDVVDALTEAGFAAAGEDSSGALVDLRSAPARVPTPAPPHRARPAAQHRSPAQLVAIVDRLRAGEAAAAADDHSAVTAPAAISELVTLAARRGRGVRIDYVDANGVPSAHVLRPSGIVGGALISDAGRFHLHRITSAAFVK